MEGFTIKFKCIFIPFIVISIATIVIYSALNWLLLINTEVFDVDDETINFLVPVVIAWLPVLIWLKPRIQLLRLIEQRNRRPLMGYLMIVWAVIAFTLVMSQQYLVTVTGKLTALNYISQIDSLPKTKYYTVKHFYISKNLVRASSVFKRIKGSYDIYIYTTCPVFNTDLNIDTTGPITFFYRKDTIVYQRPAAWLAIRYSKSISNSLPSQEKENEYNQFVKDCELSFRNQNLNDINYFDRITRTRDFRGSKEAVLSRDTLGQNPITILSPVYQSYQFKNGNKLFMMLKGFGFGSLFFLITLSFSPLKGRLKDA